MSEGWDVFFNYVYIFFVVPCALYYQMVASLTKRLNSGTLGFVKISPENLYEFFVKPKNIIFDFANFVSFWIMTPVIISSIFYASKSKSDLQTFAIYFVFIYIAWQIASVIQYFLVIYLKKSLDIILMSIFRCYENIEDEAAIYVATNGEKNYQMHILMSSDIRKMTDYDLFRMASNGCWRTLFHEKIYERLYALRKYYN